MGEVDRAEYRLFPLEETLEARQLRQPGGYVIRASKNDLQHSD